MGASRDLVDDCGCRSCDQCSAAIGGPADSISEVPQALFLGVFEEKVGGFLMCVSMRVSEQYVDQHQK